MKWIKTAIGAVIAVLTISIIATTVYKMIQLSEVVREVSFEINPEEGKYYPSSIYNEILEYGVLGENDYYNRVINIVSGYVNNEIIDLEIFHVLINPDNIYFSGDIPSLDGSIAIDSYIDAEGNWFNDATLLNNDITVKLVFEVTQALKLTGSSAILILLIPTVFAGSVLLYFYKPFKKIKIK